MTADLHRAMGSLMTNLKGAVAAEKGVRLMYIPCDKDYNICTIKESVVAFTTHAKACEACKKYKWPGMVSLGPRKWKSFQTQFSPVMVDCNITIRGEGTRNWSNIGPNGREAIKFIPGPLRRCLTKLVGERGCLGICGICLAAAVCAPLGEFQNGLFTVGAFTTAGLISPILQILVFFISASLAYRKSILSVSVILMVCAVAFTWVEAFGLFDPEVWCVAIDGINLRTLGSTKTDSPEYARQLEVAKEVAENFERSRRGVSYAGQDVSEIKARARLATATAARIRKEITNLS